MRDFRDAKAMAHALRDALKSRAIETSHSDSLELIAKAFGYDNWNILSAKIEAGKPHAGTAPALSTARAVDCYSEEGTLYCSFCGKSEDEVKALIAAPRIWICDECVELCTELIHDENPSPLWKVLRLLARGVKNGNEPYAVALAHIRDRPIQEVAAYVEHCRRQAEHNRIAAQVIRRRLAMAADEKLADDDVLNSPEFAHLHTMSKEELLALQREAQRGVQRCEDALRIGTSVLAEREPKRGA